LAEASLARELAPEVEDSSRAATESDPEFEPDRSDRMAMLAECPASRRNAANF